MSDDVIGGVMAQEVERLTRDLAAERAMRKSYEEGITWETSCLGCAKLLTDLRATEERAERAEAEILAPGELGRDPWRARSEAALAEVDRLTAALRVALAEPDDSAEWPQRKGVSRG